MWYRYFVVDSWNISKPTFLWHSCKPVLRRFWVSNRMVPVPFTSPLMLAGQQEFPSWILSFKIRWLLQPIPKSKVFETTKLHSTQIRPLSWIPVVKYLGYLNSWLHSTNRDFTTQTQFCRFAFSCCSVLTNWRPSRFLLPKTARLSTKALVWCVPFAPCGQTPVTSARSKSSLSKQGSQIANILRNKSKPVPSHL